MSNLTEAQFKDYLKGNAAFSQVEVTIRQAAIDAAEAAINEVLQRQIVLVPADAASARTFRVRGDNMLRIDDAATVTLIDGVAPTAAHQLEPLGHRSKSGQWRPYDQIRSTSIWRGDSSFGIVSVTGTWGWTVLPPQYLEADKILAKDVLANRDVSFGIAGFTEYAGVRARANPQVWDLLASLRQADESFGIA